MLKHLTYYHDRLYPRCQINGDRSLFRRSIVPKVRCSEGQMFRRAVVPKVRCSEGSLLRRFVNPKLRFIVPKTRFNIPKKNQFKRKIFFVVFNLQNSLLFLVLHKGRGRVQLQFYRGTVAWDPAVQPQYKLTRYVGL